MIGLNKFLRRCLDEGLDFKRMRFVRAVYHPRWNDYFPSSIKVSLVHRKGYMFRVPERDNHGWNCEKDEADCEILSVALTGKGVLVTLGKGSSR